MLFELIILQSLYVKDNLQQFRMGNGLLGVVVCNVQFKAKLSDYPSRASEITPGCLVRSLLFIFLGFCFVFFALFVFVLCLVYSMLPVAVSLDCPFLICLSVFSNAFFYPILYM